MKVAIIGAGNMGGAIARGLAQGHYVKASDIIVTNPSTPNITIRIEITVDSTGRFINLSNFIILLFYAKFIPRAFILLHLWLLRQRLHR